MEIDAKGIYYRQLNKLIKEHIKKGKMEFILKHVNGQRYIGDGIQEKVKIEIYGVPGNDLGAFMNGPEIIVHGNGQDGIANTMNSGKIVVHGHAGDVLGYGMRGGRVFIKGDIGYRVGIHMKSYMDQVPIIVAGGKAGDFFGEYMAGGILILLGLYDGDGSTVGNYLGTGMHGGAIYIRGNINKHFLGKEVGIRQLDEDDEKVLKRYVGEFCREFAFNMDDIMNKQFIKLIPVSHRPYGRLYTY